MITSNNLLQKEILTVSELTGRLKETLESVFGQVWLRGEISNLRQPASQHLYLTLKDKGAQLRAVMFRTRQRYLVFRPEDGQEVLVRGRLTIYEPRGEYQIVIDYMEPVGEGALRLAFEKLKAGLAGEGLFDQERKKKLPFLPQRLAVVTSPTGAALRDFIRLARRRYENAVISVYPVRVQGEGAAAEIARAVVDLNTWGGFDLILLTRGGGSLEDLWAFNEEIVARAVAASDIPVVSAVGHEIDYTICDFAADLRAPTPSAAAELIFRDKKELTAYLNGVGKRMAVTVSSRLALIREKLAHFQTRLGDPAGLLAGRRLRLDDLTEELIGQWRSNLEARKRILAEARARLAQVSPRMRLTVDRERLRSLERALIRTGPARTADGRRKLAQLTARLDGLSPLAVLKRGYALARRRPEMKTLRSSAEVAAGDRINLILAQGELDAVVDEVLK